MLFEIQNHRRFAPEGVLLRRVRGGSVSRGQVGQFAWNPHEVVKTYTVAHPINVLGNTHVKMVRLEVEAYAL
jgi:hypothetical protein